MKQFIVCLAGASLLVTTQSLAVGGIYMYQEPHGAPDSCPASVADWQYVGIRFQVDQPVEITSLQTEMGGSPSSFFAALVSLPTVASLPQGNPFGSGEVIHSTVFDLTWDYPAARQIPFSVTINPGAYAIIFGGGLFGSSGFISGAISSYQAVAGSSGFVWTPDSPSPLGPWHDTASTWNVTIQGIAIPEPSPGGIVACGLLLLTAKRKEPLRPFAQKLPRFKGPVVRLRHP